MNIANFLRTPILANGCYHTYERLFLNDSDNFNLVETMQFLFYISKKEILKARIHCEIFLSDYFMKHSSMYIPSRHQIPAGSYEIVWLIQTDLAKFIRESTDHEADILVKVLKHNCLEVRFLKIT